VITWNWPPGDFRHKAIRSVGKRKENYGEKAMVCNMTMSLISLRGICK
jgi:hypothetical protein